MKWERRRTTVGMAELLVGAALTSLFEAQGPQDGGVGGPDGEARMTFAFAPIGR